MTAPTTEGRNGSEIVARKMERVDALQGWTQRADYGDFEPVKDPGDAQSDDDEQVKPAPRRPIEAKRNISLDHGLGLRRLHRPEHFLLSRRVDH
jgi:hypothetical protein